MRYGPNSQSASDEKHEISREILAGLLMETRCVIGRRRSSSEWHRFHFQSQPPIAFPQRSHRFLLIINRAPSNDKNKWIFESPREAENDSENCAEKIVNFSIKIDDYGFVAIARWCSVGNHHFCCLQLTDRLKHLFARLQKIITRVWLGKPVAREPKWARNQNPLRRTLSCNKLTQKSPESFKVHFIIH